MRHQTDDPGRGRIHEHSRRATRHAQRHGGRGGFDGGWGPRGGFAGGFGPGFDGGRRGGRRAGRGDVRAAVLALLNEEPMHGYQIIQELGQRSEGAWTPSPGSIYPALQLLQDEGLVTAAENDGKRVFTLTEAGRTEAASRGEGPLPWEAAARSGDGDRPLRSLIPPLFAAVAQVSQAGTPEQVARAAELLTNTRRELYRILAEDDAETPTA
jgi:DNA-binding PadR family transcriptional regulator